MKKSFIYFVALILAVGTLTSCKNNKQAAEETAEATDSVAKENTLIAETETKEVPDGQMEGQGGMHVPGDIEKFWKKRVIHVPGQKSDIVALFEAFYIEWPTIESSRIVHDTNPSLAPENKYYEEGSIIDRKNGYVESIWFEGEPLGTVSACVWKRQNGHKLFAVNFHIGQKQGKDFVCFYDFDPAKRTLTPEESPIKKEHLKFPDKSPLSYVLPHEGKMLEVIEEGNGDDIVITNYEFDGQNLKFAGQQK